MKYRITELLLLKIEITKKTKIKNIREAIQTFLIIEKSRKSLKIDMNACNARALHYTHEANFQHFYDFTDESSTFEDYGTPLTVLFDTFIQEEVKQVSEKPTNVRQAAPKVSAPSSAPISKSTASDHRPKSPKTSPVPIHVVGELPKGWEARYNEEGHIFFVDHNSKSTTLLHPVTKRVISPPATAPQNTKPLPLGWEMSYDLRGRPYFINHFSKTTTYKDPRTEPLTTQPLPPGYEMRIDTQGIPYFLNHYTKTISYTDPRN